MADAASDSRSSATATRASVADWVAVFGGALGALLATLDISITNAALPEIQGAIGATGTEGTWISTGYLLTEIVMIPLAAWLTRVMGLRNFLLGNAILFAMFSAICGLAGTLPQMVIGRLGQGFTGGAMIPTAQTIIRTRLPREQLPLGMTMFGLIVILGPLLGPVVGGWLAENISWHWCFFVNFPVCVALVSLLLLGLPREKAQWHEFIKADWLGIVGLSVALSSLTVVLEEGQRELWFDSSLICALSVVSVIGFMAMGVAQFTAQRPIVRLSLLRNPRYASVIFIVFVVGAGMYGVSYLLPQFLSLVAGYNAQQSGSVLLLSGIPAFLLMPILPKLLGRADMRLLVILGLFMFVASCGLNIGLTAQSVGHDFYASQLLLGVGQILCMMPLNQASMAAVTREESGDAAGLYNMARNLGGSVGLALLGTAIDRRTHFHVATIRESLSANAVRGQDYLAASAAHWMTVASDTVEAKARALAQLVGQIQQQAVVMTFNDAFYGLAIVLLMCMPLALLLRSPRGAVALSGH